MLLVARPTVASASEHGGIAHLCTSALNRVTDRFWETWLGVNTRGGAASRHPDARDYGYLAYHTYFAVCRRLDLTRDDTVVDLGAGKGRAVCVAAQFAIRESVGVEIDPELCAIGSRNGARLRHARAPVRFVCGSAVDFDYDPVTAVILFHPFGADTMRAVLTRIDQSLLRRPRRLRIAYCNPIFDSVLTANSWLERYDQWTPRRWGRLKFAVYFYRRAVAR